MQSPEWNTHFWREGIFFVITGPSAVGKTTLMEKVLAGDDGLSYSVSHTTREKRASELDGQDYHFVSKEEFKRIRYDGGFLEWAEIYGDYYGTSRAEIERIRDKGLDPFLDIDVQGAEQLRDKVSEKAVFIFIGPPSVKELRRRVEERGSEDRKTQVKRMEVAMEELRRAGEFDYLLINDQLDRALSDLRSIIRAERLKIPK